jgi:hypothetical protein
VRGKPLLQTLKSFRQDTRCRHQQLMLLALNRGQHSCEISDPVFPQPDLLPPPMDLCELFVNGNGCLIHALHPLPAFPCCACNTSTSSCSWTSSTSATLSRNELTATRSMRFVAAWYSTRRTVGSTDPSGVVTERSRLTKGESSLSTLNACSATDARRASGKGMSRVLEWAKRRR